MIRLLRSIHDAWCDLTGRCPVPPSELQQEVLEEDRYISWLKDEQIESEHRMERRAPERDFLDSLITGREARHGS